MILITHGAPWSIHTQEESHRSPFASFAGYAVSADVVSHRAWGVGVYIIGGALQVAAAIRAPLNAVNLTNMLTLVLGGQKTQFQATICDTAGDRDGVACLQPDMCSGAGCYLHSSRGKGPSPPGPSPPPQPPLVRGSCRVGSDAFLQGQAGVNAPVPVSSWQGCADACAAYSTLPCKFWKYGGGGNWCQFFSTDVTNGAPVWPIPGAANASTSSVVSGTIPSFC